MKRIKAACICQTLHFQLKEDLEHSIAVRLVREEVEHYMQALERNRTRHKIVDEAEQEEIRVKNEGYIKRQLQDIAEVRRLEKKLLPKEINYAEISGLRLEAQEKLNRVRPENVGQAGRISGVSPADISVLVIWLSAHNEEK